MKAPQILRLLVPGLGMIGGLALISWGVISALHLSDRYQTGPVEGDRMALAAYVNEEGIIYPKLYDGERYGGTRCMPLFFLLHAAAARLVGDYLTAGKLVAFASGLLLLTVLFMTLRRLGCPGMVAVGLTGTVPLTFVGLSVTTAIRADTLAVALQLLGVAIVAWSVSPTPKVLVAAGAVCGLAVLTKLSAVWAPMAITWWLVLHHRRKLRFFLGSFAGVVIGIVAVLHVVSDGRMAANFLELLFAGTVGHGAAGQWSLRKVVGESVAAFSTLGQITWVMMPAALLSVGAAVMEKRVAIHHLAFLCAVPVTIFILGDAGAAYNHLLDLVVLVMVVLGAGWRPAVKGGAVGVLITTVAVVSWLSGTAYLLDLRVATRDAIRARLGTLEPPNSIDALIDSIPPGGRILSADPSIPLALGELPVILDPWMLLRVETRHPQWVATLAHRIGQHEFDRIILLARPEVDEDWYRDQQMGPTIATAVREHYRWIGTVDGYEVYEPRTAEPASSELRSLFKSQ